MNAVEIYEKAISQLESNQIDCGEFNKMIEPLKDVEPVRHGKWDCDIGGVWCSVCGEYSKGEWDYCPYCGAKMDRGNDDV